MKRGMAIQMGRKIGEGEADRRFERFAECLPGLAWIKDLDGRYVYVNSLAASTFARYHPDLIGKSDAEVFPKDIAEQFARNDREAIVAGPEGIRIVEKLEHEDGITHHSIVTKFPLYDEKGNVTHVAGTAIDITAQKA